MNRKNWVIVGLLVLGWIIFLGQPNAFSTKLRMIFVQLSAPFVKLGDYFPFVHARRDLTKQNDTLRVENESLRQQVRALSETGRENIRLHQLLSLKDHAQFKTIAARVIGRDTSNWWKSIQIDRGAQDELRENLAVLNGDGLIGKVVSVTKSEARVLLLTDPTCKTSALLQDSRENGVVSGSGSKLQMTFINRAAKIKSGEQVITSGLGGLFPKGVLIGTVVRSQLNAQTGMYQDAELKPSVDFNKLEEVLVILE